jgi:hypothetical protein
MYAPPYSPLAGDGERRLPHYTPVVWQEDVNPFDAFTNRPSLDAPSDASHDDDLVAPTSTLTIADLPTRRRATTRFPLVTARTFPTYNYDPWSTIRRSQAFEPPKYTPSSDLLPPPPEYASIDTQARTFRLRAPFIYASKTSNLPQYQMAKDESGTLKLRRLRPNETRACSVPAIHAGRGPKIRYDDEETLYSMTSFEMHGHGDMDLGGSVQITSGRTLWGGAWTKVWHVAKSQRRDSGQSEPERRRNTRRHEGDRTLLYSVRKGVWEDADGTVVAREEKKVLEISETWAKARERRDLVVACWVMKVWSGEGWSWEGEQTGKE